MGSQTSAPSETSYICANCGYRTVDISGLYHYRGCSSCGGTKYRCPRCGYQIKVGKKVTKPTGPSTARPIGLKKGEGNPLQAKHLPALPARRPSLPRHGISVRVK